MPRKSSSARTAILVAVTTLLSASSPATAQSSAHPDAVPPMKPNPYLKHQNPWRWDIHTQVFIRAGRVVVRNNGYQTANPDPANPASSFFEEISAPWAIESFEFIYPVVGQGGYYWSPNTDVEASLRIDDFKFEPQHARMRTPDSHAPYIWWKSEYRDERAHQFHFTQISHVVCADTVFDEKLAKQIPWPDEWPEEAERHLTPIVDQILMPVDLKAQDRLTGMVNQWLEGNDPRSIDEVTLAKFLTGKVIEHVRVGRGRSIRAPYYRPLFTNNTNDLDGLSVFPNDSSAGYFVRSADQVAIEPLGSVLDLSTMLTAVLRTAGVPARLLVCFDKSDGVDPVDQIRAMVEFAMYDKERDQILWIPIDPELLKDNGRRSRYYEQRWDYFGTHDRLRNFVPLAYYFQPPVNYRAYGYPALYGLRTTPDIGNHVSPVISIDVMNSPMSGEDFMKKDRP